MEDVSKILLDIMENKIFLSIIWLLVCAILIKIIDKAFKQLYHQNGKSIKLTFLNGIIKTIVVIFILIKIASYYDILHTFANTILMSSSLLVVVFGFIFQEGLSNIVHGCIITIFKPFEIGDRVQVNINGEIISGYVQSVNLRHTIIINVIDNAQSIIANSQLDIATIKNLTNQKHHNKYPITIGITYKTAENAEKLQKAKELLAETILGNKHYVDERENKEEPLFVKVDLAESCVNLTCFMITNTAENNVVACSEVKEALLQKYSKEHIEFAFRHLELTGNLNVRGEKND